MRSNNKQVGYFCSLVPWEIMVAAGAQPRRITGEKESTSAADGYLYPNICPYIKNVLSTAMDGGFKELDGIVFARSCDGTRRMYDVWNSHVNTGFIYMLEVPGSNDGQAVQFFASQIRDFSNAIGKAFKKKINDKSVSEAIRKTNRVRQLMRNVLFLQQTAPLPIRGSRMFETGTSLFNMDIQSSLQVLKACYQQSWGPEPASAARRKLRIMISGNVMDRPDLFQIIEDAGADVPAADLCTGLRHYDRIVDENNSDPYLALAQAYLGKPHCARTAKPADRVEEIKENVGKYAIDGVIVTSLKFCDLHLYDAPFIMKSLAEAGIPALFLENDYTFSSKGQSRVRVEAFLEMLEGERS
jgi:benzoyl-CoA reductase subunit C